MPEYLSPGVYIEEVSFRAKTIEGVSTSVTGFIGPTRYGPVGDVPELLTSFADFERIYCGVDPLQFDTGQIANYLALAVQAYFDNGGVMLYVTRIYNPPAASNGVASFQSSDGSVTLQARFPGAGGNMQVSFTAKLSASLISKNQPDITKSNLQLNDLVFVVSKNTAVKSGFYDATKDVNGWNWVAADGVTKIPLNEITLANMDVYGVTLSVSVQRGGRFEVSTPLGVFAPNSAATSGITLQSYFVDPPPSRDRTLHQPFFIPQAPTSGAQLAQTLLGTTVTQNLLQQGIPAMSGLSLASLLTLDINYLRSLGFDPGLLTGINENSFPIAILQQLPQATLAKLNIGALQALTPALLSKAHGTADETVLVNAINLRALSGFNFVPYWALSLKLLEGLHASTVTNYQIGATLKTFDPQTLTLADIQALSTSALTKLGLLPLKTVSASQWPAGITTASTLADLANPAKVSVAQLNALGIASDAVLTNVTNTTFQQLSLADVQALSPAAQTALGLNQTVNLTVSQFLSVTDAGDRQAIANAVGIPDLTNPGATWLNLLTVGDLQNLTGTEVLPTGLTLPNLKAVNSNFLKTNLTLADIKPLPLTSLQTIGADVLRTVAARLPLKPSDLTNTVSLSGGDDGLLPTELEYHGADPVSATDVKTGLRTFMDIDEISIVAAPGSSFIGDPAVDAQAVRAQGIANELITHVELMRYRVAVLDMPNQQILSDATAYRSLFDSEYAAIYYPWVTIMDPNDPTGVAEIDVPPSGYVTGIYARNDDQRSVAKAPANEVLHGVIGLEYLVNTAQQDILNPLGVNCIRSFPNRGIRIWGARTISSDSDFTYINVRRYFAYLEHSIDKGTQFVVFENNNPNLWDSVKATISDFLFNEWKNNNLIGTKPTDAYFVRCDRSTMTQNDIDNGRLVCLIGVVVNKPAEFVIFRIGQMTADSTS